MWDLATGIAIRTLEEHVSGINAVAALPEGRAIAASHDKTLKVWDIDRGTALMTLQGHGNDVKSVAVTRDGRRAVSLSYDGTLRGWDLRHGTEAFSRPGVYGWSTSVAITPDGRQVIMVVGGFGSNAIRGLDLEGGSEWTVDWSAGVNGVAVTNHLAFIAPDQGDIAVIDLRTRGITRRIPAAIGGLSGVAVTADGRRLIVVSWSGVVQLWDVETWELLATFHTDGLLTSCAISADGTHAVAGDKSGQVHLLRIETA